MKILIVNAGSSSLKYQLLDMVNEEVLSKGLVERIGTEDSSVTYCNNDHKVKYEKSVQNHTDAVRIVFEILTSSKDGVISDIKEIGAVGHRVVHGADKYSSSVLIDDDVMKTLEDCVVYAPLHNPANIKGIKACRDVLPDVPMVGVFDTAFHQTIPDYAFMYALPYEMYKKYGIRKYGFHGTSHRYVSQVAMKLLGKVESKIISCHLGNGASICAIKDGKSVDTSMGHTPTGGLMMGTRSGDIDPEIFSVLQSAGKFSVKEIDNMLNKESGMLGVSGISNDFRDLEDALHRGDKRAKLALEMFDYTLRKYVGAYTFVLKGLDALIFTAGIGENDWETRYEACKGLEPLGLFLDEEKNKQVKGVLAEISTPESRVKVYVIPTNEELMIARDTKSIVESSK
ncbi:MAG: acetate kinase [Ignavibacteria bacterium]|jgi:acetate kinase|nr:acetate kinase [Ignavibacteria bacterium]